MIVSSFSSDVSNFDTESYGQLSLDLDRSRELGLPVMTTPSYIKPHIALSPFGNGDLSFETQPLLKSSDHLLKESFGKDFLIFPRAIFGLSYLIDHLKISGHDDVAIIKTFNNGYISRCVTETIKEKCNISNKIGSKTKAVMIIHEFGHVCQDILRVKKECKSTGIPLIENCAWMLGGKINATINVGSVGDFTIYSLTKVLPMQYGGILTGVDDHKGLSHVAQSLTEQILFGLKKFLPSIENCNQKRIANWNYLNELFGLVNYHPIRKLSAGEVPAVFIVRTDDYEVLHKKYLGFGVETGRYYHERGLILPCHQNLSKSHLEYIFGIFVGHLALKDTHIIDRLKDRLKKSRN